MTPRELDFVVLGAQKAGTTTLFHLLREHPQLWLPPSKEASFFNRPELHERGGSHLMELFFKDAPTGRVLGKVSPEYMSQPGVAANLHAAFPSTRLVAILREPVARAMSHHRMMVRRGEEERPFDRAIRDQLDHIEVTRHSRSGIDTYVASGEYGRVLEDYRRYFPSEQLLVIATDDLEANPDATLRRVHEFLGVQPITPPNIGARHHVGGSRQRIPGVQRRAERSGSLRRAWHLLPQRHRDLIWFRFDQWNVKRAPADDQPGLTAALDQELAAHFAEDARLLAEVTGFGAPWSNPG